MVGSRQSLVLLVDDHPIVCEGLKQLIERDPNFKVHGQAGDAVSALRAISVFRPDIVIMDVSLNGPSGIEVMREIRQTDANLRVLVLSMHDEMVYAERALRAGANGYIMKQSATDNILAALRRILGGDIYVSERVAGRILKRFSGGGSALESRLDALTDREMEVFRLIGAGRGTRDIAAILQLSIKTVETYQAHIRDKIGVRSARELSQYAIQWTISDGGGPSGCSPSGYRYSASLV